MRRLKLNLPANEARRHQAENIIVHFRTNRGHITGRKLQLETDRAGGGDATLACVRAHLRCGSDTELIVPVGNFESKTIIYLQSFIKQTSDFQNDYLNSTFV